MALLLMALLCCCRSHKEVQSNVVEAATVIGQSRESCDSVSRILDLLLTVEQVELSEISLDFFPPAPSLNNDSLHPEIRAVPKSVHIGKATISRNTEAASFSSSEVNASTSQAYKADSSSEASQHMESDAKVLSTLDLTIAISIVAALLVAGFLVYFKYFRKRKN